MSKKEVAVKTNTDVIEAGDFGDWGSNNMTSGDLIIPKLWAMQKTSAMVDSDEAAFGDLINSITKETLGTFDNGVNVIPIWMYKTWLATEGGKFISLDPAMDPNERAYEANGVRNEFCYNFYVMVEGHGDVPFVVTFKGKSRKAGKQLATQMYVLNQAAKLPPCGQVMHLFSSKESNDKGTFAVLKVRPERHCTKDEARKALEWFKHVSKKQMNVDDKDIVGDTGKADVTTEDF